MAFHFFLARSPEVVGWKAAEGPLNKTLLTPTLSLMPLDHGEARKKDHQKPRP